MINLLIKKLHLKGFTSYIDSELSFDNDESFIATITAPNGSGKSSILEAITTALFYRARGVDNRGTGMDELINNQSDYFEITFEFVMDNVDYKIIRRKSRGGKHELEFYIDGISQTEKVTETQEKINSVIKMNYETFLDTVCIGQGLSGNFMKKKPNERKDVFIEVLNLNQFEDLEKYAKEQKKILNNSLIEKTNSLKLVQDNIDSENEYRILAKNYAKQATDYSTAITAKGKELDKVKEDKMQYELLVKQNEQLTNHKKAIQTSIENNETKIKNATAKINNIKSKIDKLKIKFKSDKTSVLELQNTNTELTDNLNSLVVEEVDLSIKDTTNAKIDELLKIKSEIDSKKAKVSTQGQLEKEKINSLQEQYDNLNNYNQGICSFCGNDITAEHKEKHLANLTAQIDACNSNIKTYKQELEQLSEQLTELGKKYTSYKTQLSEIDAQIDKVNKVKLQREKIQANITNNENTIKTLKQEMQTIKEQKTEFDFEITQLQQDIVELNKEKENLNEQAKEYSNVEDIPFKTFNDKQLETELSSLREKQIQAESNKAIYKDKLEKIKEDKVVCTQIEQEIDDLQTKISDYESLSEAFSKKGIQADMIANVLPDIEDEINKVLEILFNNSTTIEFVTQKDDKKSKAKSATSLETLDIVIHDRDKDRTYETYSGGEKFRIDFACHIGLSKFLAKRAKSNIELFMIDEGLGSQDDEGRGNFILTINKLSGMFKQIFIITHIDELKEAFDKKIIINKDNIQGSKITVI